MNCVLILFILTAVASVPQPNNCRTFSHLEKSEAVMVDKMMHKNATLYALCRFLIETGCKTPWDAQVVLNGSKEHIWKTYNGYQVSIIRTYLS